MRNAEITKQKILIESGNLFNTQGYQATSISDITKATGLTKGAIYRHFESKSDLEQQALKALSDLMFFELGTAIKKATNFTSKMEATFLFFEKYMGTPLYKGGCPLLNAAVEVDETHSVLRKQVREMLLQLKTSLKTIIQNGWDVAAMNHRGCSGEENRLYKSYHSGRTQDLNELIQHISTTMQYQKIALIGFSLGGNLLLKYLGETSVISNKIAAGIAISAPIHLHSSLLRLMQKENLPYTLTFLRDLRKKYKRKMKLFPEIMTKEKLNSIKTLLDFDTIYTAPAHGFKDAAEYYKKSSALPFLPHIKHPVLLLNAANDSFLAAPCFPFDIAKDCENVFLEVPSTGGHVGFHISNTNYYSEHRIISFLDAVV